MATLFRSTSPVVASAVRVILLLIVMFIAVLLKVKLVHENALTLTLVASAARGLKKLALSFLVAIATSSGVRLSFPMKRAILRLETVTVVVQITLGKAYEVLTDTALAFLCSARLVVQAPLLTAILLLRATSDGTATTLCALVLRNVFMRGVTPRARILTATLVKRRLGLRRPFVRFVVEVATIAGTLVATSAIERPPTSFVMLVATVKGRQGQVLQNVVGTLARKSSMLPCFNLVAVDRSRGLQMALLKVLNVTVFVVHSDEQGADKVKEWMHNAASLTVTLFESPSRARFDRLRKVFRPTRMNSLLASHVISLVCSSMLDNITRPQLKLVTRGLQARLQCILRVATAVLDMAHSLLKRLTLYFASAVVVMLVVIDKALFGTRNVTPSPSKLSAPICTVYVIGLSEAAALLMTALTTRTLMAVLVRWIMLKCILLEESKTLPPASCNLLVQFRSITRVTTLFALNRIDRINSLLVMILLWSSGYSVIVIRI